MTCMNQKPSCILSLILFFSTILVAYSADAKPHFSHFCVKAIDKSFCSKVVNGSKTWKEALSKAVVTTFRHVKRAKPLVDNLMTNLPSTLPPAAKHSICETCKNSYGSVIHELNAAMDAVNEGDEEGKLNFMLSAASTELGECSKAFLDFKVRPKNPLFKSNEVTAKLISTCLAVENASPQ